MTNNTNQNIINENINIENNNSTTCIKNINDFFKLPIYYNNNKCILKHNIINDLELIETTEQSGNSIYDYYFNVNNQFASQTSKQISNYFTTDIPFLKDNQKLICSYKKNEEKYTNY